MTIITLLRTPEVSSSSNIKHCHRPLCHQFTSKHNINSIMAHLGHQQKISKLKKFRLFIKSIKSKVHKNKRERSSREPRSLPQFLPTVTHSPPSNYQYPNPYSYTYTSFRSSMVHPYHRQYPASCIGVAPAAPLIKQHVPHNSMFTESEYEEMTNDFCTLPKKKMKLRIKQRMFEKSLNAILLEAKREIIEESSGDEHDDTYVPEARDNIYEELNLTNSFIDEIYEEII